MSCAQTSIVVHYAVQVVQSRLPLITFITASVQSKNGLISKFSRGKRIGVFSFFMRLNRLKAITRILLLL